MRTALRKMGNSAGMIVPKAILSEIGSAIGEELDIKVESGRIVAAPVRGAVRGGWAEAAQALAQTDDDAPVWPDFANDEDESLEW
jgi:antitoxin MazE